LIYIPLDKVLVAVHVGTSSYDNPTLCEECFCDGWCGGNIACCDYDRKDGKNVIFKLFDLPKEVQE